MINIINIITMNLILDKLKNVIKNRKNSKTVIAVLSGITLLIIYK